MSSPHEVAHLHLVGEGSPGLISTMVRLAAHLSGFSTCQISANLSSGSSKNVLERFKAELVNIYTRAGVKVRKQLILMLNLWYII